MPRRAAEPLEVRCDGRVAVDRGQLAVAVQPLREQRRMTARAECRVDDGLSRPRVERGDYLVGEDWDVV